MIALTITLDATQDKMDAIQTAKHIDRAFSIAIGGVPDGCESGAPSVGIVMELGEGVVAFGETTLALFLTAADTLAAKYGDPRDAQGFA